MQTKLDQIANQNHLQLLKALLPYLPVNSQKTFSVLIKTIEMQNVMNYYQTKETDSQSSSDLLDILTDIRQYCEGDEREMIDQALQMISMIELYQVCAESAP